MGMTTCDLNENLDDTHQGKFNVIYASAEAAMDNSTSFPGSSRERTLVTRLCTIKRSHNSLKAKDSLFKVVL